MPIVVDGVTIQVKISIHAPHTRSDNGDKGYPLASVKDISIHAPHTRSDVHLYIEHRQIDIDFNPRPSYEERRQARRFVSERI